MIEKPKCPTCVESHVSNASYGDQRAWLCIKCGKRLGPAPHYEPQWERQTIEKDNK